MSRGKTNSLPGSPAKRESEISLAHFSSLPLDLALALALCPRPTQRRQRVYSSPPKYEDGIVSE